MITFLNVMIIVAVIAVALTLVAGLFNLARGGEGAGERSTKLMRWRVILQLVVGFIAKRALSGS